MTLKCPNCGSTFPMKYLAIPQRPGVEATLVCPICRETIDVRLSARKLWPGLTINARHRPRVFEDALHIREHAD